MLTRMHVVSLVSLMFTCCVYVPGELLTSAKCDRVIFHGHEPGAGSDLVTDISLWYLPSRSGGGGE